MEEKVTSNIVSETVSILSCIDMVHRGRANYVKEHKEDIALIQRLEQVRETINSYDQQIDSYESQLQNLRTKADAQETK